MFIDNGGGGIIFFKEIPRDRPAYARIGTKYKYRIRNIHTKKKNKIDV